MSNFVTNAGQRRRALSSEAHDHGTSQPSAHTTPSTITTSINARAFSTRPCLAESQPTRIRFRSDTHTLLVVSRKTSTPCGFFLRPVRHNARAAPRTPIRKEPAGPKPAGSDRPPAIPRLPSDELPKQRRRAATLFLAARLHKGGEAQRFPGVSLSAVPAAGANGGAARRSDAAASGAGPTDPALPPESP